MGCGSSKEIAFDDSDFYAFKPEGERFNDSIFINENRTRVVSWLPMNEPKGIVLVSHGLHEHILKYHIFAHALTAAGFGVFGPDHYAHGKSHGTRALIDDCNILVSEFIDFSNWVHGQYPNTPVFVFGHSMGSLVVLAAIAKIPFAKSLCISGVPMISGPGSSSPFGIQCLYPISQTSYAASLGSLMSSLDPKGPLAPIPLSTLTRNQAVLDRIPLDPYYYHGWMMNKTGTELLKLIVDVKAALPGISLPLLVIHGAEDTVCLVRGAQQLIDGVSSSQKVLKVYPGARHELFYEIEPTASDSIKEVVDFFNSFSTSFE